VARRLTLVAALIVLLASTTPAQADLRDLTKPSERHLHITATPAYQAARLKAESRRAVQELQILTSDPERSSLLNICSHRFDACAGDVRLYDWVRGGRGIALPVLFTSRSGATLSGHIWATAAGPAKRPGVVITNGSIQASEEMYWYAAQTLAKAGADPAGARGAPPAAHD
jgi:hypothetical protein